MQNVGRWIRFFVLVSATVLLASCGYQSQNGVDASIRAVSETSQYSAVVLVTLPNGKGICTGTFVSEKAVLTAAHCALEDGRYQVVSDFGTFTTNDHFYLGRGVVESDDDLALLVFDHPVASRSSGQVFDLGRGIQRGEEIRLVGFGCQNINTKTGAGIKRTGTNQVGNVSEYIEFYTPASPRNSAINRGIIGPENQAGSCFGDSGGPAMREIDGKVELVGVTHAGGPAGNAIVSLYTNVASDSGNIQWLQQMNYRYGLDIRGL